MVEKLCILVAHYIYRSNIRHNRGVLLRATIHSLRRGGGAGAGEGSRRSRRAVTLLPPLSSRTFSLSCGRYVAYCACGFDHAYAKSRLLRRFFAIIRVLLRSIAPHAAVGACASVCVVPCGAGQPLAACLSTAAAALQLPPLALARRSRLQLFGRRQIEFDGCD